MDGVQSLSDAREIGYIEGLEHYYSDELLTNKINALIDEDISREQFIETALKNMARLIRENPLRYRSFGMYWWHVKDLLNERIHDPTAWWYGGYVDGRIMELTDRGSDAKNLMQAVTYHSENWTNSGQQDYVLNGVNRVYSLFDQDCIEE